MRTLPLIALLLSGCCCDLDRDPPAAPAPRAAPKPTELEAALAAMTAEDDAKHEALVALAQKNRWIGDVNWERREVVVGPVFSALDFKVKQAVAQDVVLVGLRRQGARKGTFLGASYDLDLLDPKTNKLVGTYSTLWWKLTLE